MKKTQLHKYVDLIFADVQFVLTPVFILSHWKQSIYLAKESATEKNLYFSMYLFYTVCREFA